MTCEYIITNVLFHVHQEESMLERGDSPFVALVSENVVLIREINDCCFRMFPCYGPCNL